MTERNDRVVIRRCENCKWFKNGCKSNKLHCEDWECKDEYKVMCE